MRKLPLLFAALLLAASARAAAPAAPGPLFHEAVDEFRSMRSTLYDHKVRVNRGQGTYDYDCVGFVSYALQQAAPRAWASVAKATDLKPHRIPTPAKYQKFLADLAARPQPGWQAVTNVADLRPGDVISWEHKTATASGHAVIVASVPNREPNGSWSLEIYDSTSSPHANDSRPDDRRAQILPSSGKPSGLGHGMMALTADPHSGALIGYRWSPKATAVPCPIAAGRPTH